MAAAAGARRRGLTLVLAEGLVASARTLRPLIVAIGAVGKVVAHPRHVHTLAIVTVEQMRLASTSSAHHSSQHSVIGIMMMLAVLLVAAIAAVTLLVAAELLTYALFAFAALELIDAANLATIGFILATWTLGSAIATYREIQTELQIAGALIHWSADGATSYVSRRRDTASLIAVQLIGHVATIVVAIADQTLVQTLTEQASMHVLWALTMPAFTMLVRGVIAIDASIAFPATGNT